MNKETLQHKMELKLQQICVKIKNAMYLSVLQCKICA